MNRIDLRKAIGLADLCEISSVAFTFPEDDRLAKGLADGSFCNDLVACLEDAGAVLEDTEKAVEILDSFAGQDEGVLHDRLRKGFSVLYFAPNTRVPVQPYESPFMHVATGYDGQPVLFRSACTLDVERQMREAGVLPKNARKEPCDSVWNELAFLSFAYGSLAAAMHEQREGDVVLWEDRVKTFWDDHASKWLFAFMEKTREEAVCRDYGAEYAQLASLVISILRLVEDDVKSMRAR